MLLETIALAFPILLLVVAAMAVGVVFTGRRITGSCGGLSAIPGTERCGVCGRDLRDATPGDCGKASSKKGI